jgi:hypothetical protein
VNKVIHLLALSAAALVVAGCAGNHANKSTPTRVGDFSLLDQKGYFHQMSYYNDHKAIALLVQRATAVQRPPQPLLALKTRKASTVNK